MLGERSLVLTVCYEGSEENEIALLRYCDDVTVSRSDYVTQTKYEVDIKANYRRKSISMPTRIGFV